MCKNFRGKSFAVGCLGSLDVVLEPGLEGAEVGFRGVDEVEGDFGGASGGLVVDCGIADEAAMGRGAVGFSHEVLKDFG